jgi:hypothetical protein
MVIYFRILLILFTVTYNILAQNISVSASVDTSEYIVGDYIKYQLELRYNKNIKISLPSIKDSIKVLDFIETLKPEKREVNDDVIESLTFIFSKYDSAEVTIPSYKIYYTSVNDTTKKFLAVNPLTIVIRTLQVNPQEEIRDIKEPIKLPPNWLLIIGIALLSFGLLVGLYYLYRHYKKNKEGKILAEPEVKIPPHEVALVKLDQLAEKKLWQRGLVKQFHSEITEIIRGYFEDRFNFRALEMTSSEILAVLSYLEEAKIITDTTYNFLSNADLVKFAKFEPIPQVNEEMMKLAYHIITETILKPIVTDALEVQETENV